MVVSHATRSIIASVVLAAVLTAAGSVPAAGQPIACPRAVFAPVLDGRLDDWPRLPHALAGDSGSWHPAAVEFAEYGGPEDVSWQLRLAWDNQALYVALETRDDALTRVTSAAEIDRGDSVVLAFAAPGARDVSQFVVALLKSASLVWRAEPAELAGEVRTIGRALWARPEEDGGYRVTYELSIPWSELRQIRPIPGAEFTVTISACDDDAGGLEGCLERSLPVKLSAAGVADIEPRPLPAVSLAPVFAAPEAGRFDERCFSFDGRDTLVAAGEIDYAHLSEEAWARSILLLERAGLNAVAATVAWSHHQPTPGAIELGDLHSFLDLCRSASLLVQLNVGPFADVRLPAGGVPGWVAAASVDEREQAVAEWLDAVGSLATEYQIAAGGPVAYVVVVPMEGERSAALGLARRLQDAGVAVPIVTADGPEARDGTRQAAVNLLDTVSLYAPMGLDEVAARVRALAEEEIGPAAVTALVGDYHGATAARRSADHARVALGCGATALSFADFAPGIDATVLRGPPGYRRPGTGR
jgi:hypothetical protein